MNKDNKYLEAKIRRLNNEIKGIDDFFYYFREVNSDDDLLLHASMLERKRDDMVRSIVLQLHTGIEDILTSWMTCRILGIKINEKGKQASTKSGLALRRVLSGSGSIGFDMKLNLAVALRLINSSTQKKLVELNQLRNKCSHNWLLNTPVRRGKRPKQKKPPLLLYKGHDLHSVDVLKEFSGAYGVLYANLFAKYVAEAYE